MKLVCILADTKHSIGRVHQDIADAFAGEYEFIFHYDAAHYRHIMLADFDRCDIFLTTFNLLNSLVNSTLKGKDLRKVLFIAHYAHEWTWVKESPYLNICSYCTISEAVTESFPGPIHWTPSGINPAFFKYTPRSGQIQKMGWVGNLAWVSKRIDWAREIAAKAELDVSIVTTTIPFLEMSDWYQTIDVYVVTTGPEMSCETGPLPPFEAVLCGVPVIGTRVGNFRLLPGPKFTTIEEAVAILEDLKAHPEKAVALAKEQYDAVMKDWTISAVLPRWRATFEAVIDRSTSRMLDYIEIGTSDFETEIQLPDEKCGISIEPVKYYFDRLPDKKGCIKLNLGVSNCNSSTVVYYLSEDTIKKYDFPEYVRGCNSIHSPHQTVRQLCNEKGLDVEAVSEKYPIDIVTLHTVISQHNVHGMYLLKVDTEGHDYYILKKFHDDLKDNRLLPHVLLFESNILSSAENINAIFELFSAKGYDIVYRSGHDSKMRLNLNKLANKSGFSAPFRNYYIMDYPANYNRNALPHPNTLEGAQEYCVKHGCTGVTYENGVYEVRGGPYMNYYKDANEISWVYL